MAIVARTDYNWLDDLRSLNEGKLDLNEVNFWTPSPWNLKKARHGDKQYFALGIKQRNGTVIKIGGYGEYSSCIEMTTQEAWTRFGRYNGVDSLTSLNKIIEQYNEKSLRRFDSSKDKIGCIILNKTVILDDNKFLYPPEGWNVSKYLQKFMYVRDEQIPIKI